MGFLWVLVTPASAAASPGKSALAALALHILEIPRAAFHLASVAPSESGPSAPEKSQDPTSPSWLQGGQSRYSIPGSGAGKKAPSRDRDEELPWALWWYLQE